MDLIDSTAMKSRGAAWPSRPADGSDQGPEAFLAMKALAMGEAFSLRHGREALQEPEAYAQASAALGHVLSERVAALEERVDFWRRQSEAEDLGGKAEGASRSLGMTWKLGMTRKLAMDFARAQPLRLAEDAQPHEIEAFKLMDELDAKEQLALMAMCEASGAWADAMDPKRSAKLASDCGLHLSQMELSLSERRLENLRDGYFVEALDAESGVHFKASPKAEKIEAGLSGAPASETMRRAREEDALSMLLLTTAPSIPRILQDGAHPVWKAFALRGACATSERLSAAMRSQADGNDLGGMTARHLAALGLEKAREALAEWREGVAPEQAALSLMSRPWSTKTEAALAFRAAVEALADRAEQVKARDKAARACSWYDKLAGARSTELVAKVLDADPLSKASFRTLETIASHARDLWAAMEGQEALGLFSIRAAGHLGLKLGGRDLPERTKAAMMDRFGMSEGGWRLLGKLAASSKPLHSKGSAPAFGLLLADEGDSTPAAKAWLDRCDGLVESATPMKASNGFVSRMQLVSEHESLHDGLRSFMQEIGDMLAASPASKPEMEIHSAAAEFQKRDADERDSILRMFGALLTACSSAGASPAQAEELLNRSLKKAKSMSIVFGRPVDGSSDAPAGQQETERAAWLGKAPRLLGSFVARALRGGMGNAFDEMMAAKDWMNDSEGGAWRELPDKPAWADVNARQRRWHEMVQQRERGEAASTKWESLVDGMSSDRGAYAAHALTDGGMLWDEGKAMSHCVSTYVDECEGGGSRIFSIRKDGARLGTLELALDSSVDGGTWAISQFLGRHNADILDEEANALAGRVEQAYNAAFKLAARASAAGGGLEKGAGLASTPEASALPGQPLAEGGVAPLGLASWRESKAGAADPGEEPRPAASKSAVA